MPEETHMHGLMQDRQLLISTLIDHAADCHAGTAIVSREADGSLHATSWGEVANRSRRLARALQRLGIRPADRVATLAWNTHRHLELYYGITGTGAICHTVNPRLFFDQIVFILRHAEDTALFFDESFADLARRLQRAVPAITHWVVLGPRRSTPELDAIHGLLFYEELIAAEDAGFTWVDMDERHGASLCYTSGTTGDPKGVLYSHRSTVLHAYAACMPDCFDISARDVVMPASSMYHANAWGVPYAATMAGARMVLPGGRMDPASLHGLIETYGVTHSFGVPTIWLGFAQHLEAHGLPAGSLRKLVIGGAACPPALTETYARLGVQVRQLWGMTETSPLGVVGAPKAGQENLQGEALATFRAQQGRTVFGVQLKIEDEIGVELPRDGVASGNLMIRGWWIASRYYGQLHDATRHGWFPTGDVATLDRDGFMRITDRAKDMIKSGGEWISSIDLENEAVAHPSVAEAAVIGVPHPKWDERPLLILRLKPDACLDREEMIAFLRKRIAKWWLPDDIVVVEEIPHTATGKIQKNVLREQFVRHLLPSQAA
jgi:fatty-acyl-CoA synthase